MVRNSYKKAASIFLSASLLFGATPIYAKSEQNQQKFSDITGHWAEKAIQKWTENGRITGYSDGTFVPSKPITRAEYVAFTVRILELSTDDDGSVSTFKDVKSSDWFYKDVQAAAAAGMISGYGDGQFRPNQLITRQEAAVFTARLLQLNENQDIPDYVKNYKDADAVKNYATSSISALSVLGLLKGSPEGLFLPDKNMGRADALVLLDRLAQKTIEQSPGLDGFVFDENGNPISKATLVIQDSETGEERVTLHSDTSGAYNAELEAGTYNVVITTDTRTTYTQKVLVSSQRRNLAIHTAIPGQVVTGTLTDRNGTLLKNVKFIMQSEISFAAETNENGVFKVVLPLKHAFTVTYKDGSQKMSLKTFRTGDRVADPLDLGTISASSSKTVLPSSSSEASMPSTSGNPNNGHSDEGSQSGNPSLSKPSLTLKSDNGILSFQIGSMRSGTKYSIASYLDKKWNDESEAKGSSIELPLPQVIGMYEYRAIAEDVNGQKVESEPIHYMITTSGSGEIAKDSDGDGIEDQLELELGTDPNDSDTDKDGLSDGYEYFMTHTSPLKKDTDDNGVLDNEEDLDGDGLTNEQEKAAATSPLLWDTDSDGLSDSEEINLYRTDPLKKDTDGDGLSDGDEIVLGLDPLKRDTNGNGIPDNEESIEQTISATNMSVELAQDNAAVPSLTVTAQGNMNQEVFLREYTGADLGESRAILGKAVEIGGGVFSEAALNFDIGTQMRIFAENSDMQSLLISRRNADGTVTHFDTEYSDDGQRVSASIDGPGTYFVMDAKELFSELGLTFPTNSESSFRISGFSEEGYDLSSGLSDEEKASMSNDTPITDSKLPDDQDLESDIPQETPDQEIQTPVSQDSHSEPDEQQTMQSNAEQEQQQTLPQFFAAEPLQTEKSASLLAAGQTDIVFIIDSTGSMGDEINNVRNNVAAFADSLKDKNIAAYLGLVEYKDEQEEPGSTTVHRNGSKNWFSDIDQFKSAVRNLTASGGGDEPESAVDALEMARQLDLRPNAKKFFVLITDATYKQSSSLTMQEEIERLKSQGIYTSVVSMNGLEPTYRNLYSSTDGIFANIYGNFTVELQLLADRIGEVVEEDGVWIYLDTLIPTAVKVDVLPENADESIDSDNDGVADIHELKSVTPIEKYDLDKIVDLVTGGEVTGTHLGKVKVYPFNSNPADPDTDKDGYGDADDLNPKIKFVTPIILLHGRISNTDATFGAATAVAGNNDQYDAESSVNHLSYRSFADQRIGNLIAGNGSEKTPTNLGYELQLQGYQKNKNLFAFNYPNKDMVHLNAARLQAYLQDGAEHLIREEAGYFYPTRQKMESSDYQVNLIGHSMGGLVSRYFIENLHGGNHVQRLITIDTPHWGSGLADAAKFVSPMFVPGDLDLDPSGRAYGGKGYKDERNEWLYNEKGNYAVTHQTERLKHENAPNGKYFFIGAYDDAAPYLLSSELRGRTFGFDVNPDSNSFEDFRNSIAEAFYAQYGLRDRISFTFTTIGGDNVVNNQSQLGIRFGSGASDRIARAKSYMFIDTFFGHNAAASVHVEITHRKEAADQVLSYLQ